MLIVGNHHLSVCARLTAVIGELGADKATEAKLGFRTKGATIKLRHHMAANALLSLAHWGNAAIDCQFLKQTRRGIGQG